LLSDFVISYVNNKERIGMIPFTDEELLAPVKNVIDKVRPSLVLDGGDIEFITVKNSVVYIQLRGACVGCASSGTTLKYGVERQLKMDIHPELTVLNVPQGMEDSIDNL
jgi:Fe-S cluster biogenesis protein NfuA